MIYVQFQYDFSFGMVCFYFYYFHYSSVLNYKERGSNSIFWKNEKRTENHFIPENALFYTLKFEQYLPPNSHPSILPIKLYLAPRVNLLLPPYIKKFVLTTHIHSFLDPL